MHGKHLDEDVVWSKVREGRRKLGSMSPICTAETYGQGCSIEAAALAQGPKIMSHARGQGGRLFLFWSLEYVSYIVIIAEFIFYETMTNVGIQ
jgi:hypothetical protein